MRHLLLILVLTAPVAHGCAGCLGFGDTDDEDARDENPHIFIPDDAGSVDDAGETASESDGGGSADASSSTDGSDMTAPDTAGDGGDGGTDGSTDAGEDDGSATCGDGVVEGTEVCDDGNTSPGDYCSLDCSTETGSCGDGIEQTNETCDDGQITQGCDTMEDGGDGICRPPGTCSDGYVHDGNGCVPAQLDEHVHIYVDNFCNLSVDPVDIHVPTGQSVYIDWHNHSVDYEVDVWMSYGGGFLDLARGATWDEPIEHCTNVNRPYTEYADISIAGLGVNDSTCPGHRFMIYCD